MPSGIGELHEESGTRLATLDQEIKELISALTGRLTNIQRGQKSGDITAATDDDQGARIITLAGTNLGATMHGEVDDKSRPQGQAQPEQDDFTTYVNNNFQAINNSIMVGGSYETNDPGVHLDIMDHAENNEHKNSQPSEPERS